MEFEAWRREYAASRYLRYVSDSVLTQRLNDLAANMWCTDTEGNVVARRDDKQRPWFLRLCYHVLLERVARTGETVGNFDEAGLIAGSSANYRPPTLKRPLTDESNCVWKFGMPEHIASAFERGVLKSEGKLTYYDPYLMGEAGQGPIPIFSKHFAYAYQNEYRFAWTVGAGEEPLKPFLVELGPLKDITALVEVA